MLRGRILKSLKHNDSNTISDLSKKLKINRIFLAGYLQALEESGEITSKKIGVAKVYQINKSNLTKVEKI